MKQPPANGANTLFFWGLGLLGGALVWPLLNVINYVAVMLIAARFNVNFLDYHGFTGAFYTLFLCNPIGVIGGGICGQIACFYSQGRAHAARYLGVIAGAVFLVVSVVLTALFWRPAHGATPFDPFVASVGASHFAAAVALMWFRPAK